MGDQTWHEAIYYWFYWRVMPFVCLFKGHVMRRTWVFTKANQETAADGCICDRCCETWQFQAEEL